MPCLMIKAAHIKINFFDTYNFAVPSRIALWQHVGNLWSLSSYFIRKWLARRGTQTRDSELVCPPR